MSFGDKNFTYGPRIVKDGLVFYVDAANPKSYVSGDTTCTDLVGGNVGSLQNGVGFSVENNGTWSFDGSDDYINITSALSTQPVYHLSVWFTRTSGINTSYTSNDRYLLGWGGSGNLTGISFGDFTGAADDETIFLYQDSQGLDNFTYIKDTADSDFHNLVINWDGSQYDICLLYTSDAADE